MKEERINIVNNINTNYTVRTKNRSPSPKLARIDVEKEKELIVKNNPS